MNGLPWPPSPSAGEWIAALAPVLLVAGVAWALGWAVRRASGCVPPARRDARDRLSGGRTAARLEAAAGDTAIGMAAVGLLMLLLDALEVSWRPLPLLVAFGTALAGAAGVRAWSRERGGTASRETPPLGWGDLLALSAWGSFAAIALGGWITTPDFVYHWGIKGLRYWLAAGIDWPYLADPFGIANHPDYPQLLPSLYGLVATVRGSFDPRSMLALSAVFVLLAMLAGREALGRGGARGAVLQAGSALVALTATFFRISHDLAGGADILIALALLLALPSLLAPRGSGAQEARDDLRLGLAAALAAAAKIEGVPLALFLVCGRVLGSRRAPGHLRWRDVVRRGPRLLLPSLVVVLPWLEACLRLDLFSGANTGSWESLRLPVVARGVLMVLSGRDWFGLPWILATLPLLLFVPRLRAAAAVILCQAGFYGFVYLTAPVDTASYVAWSLPRLLYQLLLPTLVLAVLALGPSEGGGGHARGDASSRRA